MATVEAALSTLMIHRITSAIVTHTCAPGLADTATTSWDIMDITREKHVQHVLSEFSQDLHLCASSVMPSIYGKAWLEIGSYFMVESTAWTINCYDIIDLCKHEEHSPLSPFTIFTPPTIESPSPCNFDCMTNSLFPGLLSDKSNN